MIALCDDSKSVHNMMKLLLGESDYQVESCFNAYDLIALTETSSDIDVIFLDWEMPEFAGIDALQFMINSGCTIPIYMLSGKNSGSHVDRAMAAGAKGYIINPFTKDLILATLKELKNS